MEKLVEVVPNFSEGRRKEVVEDIINAILSVSGTHLLDMEMDPDHNRSVVTFVATPETAVEAAFLGVKRASELIDLTKHEGQHPRIGATDVIPFVPLKNVSMEECILLAEELGKRIAEELNIPVYLYEEAARVPERKNLATIRKGEFEGLRELIKTDPTRKPDFGPSELHPTAGATVVGARKVLIAYNVNLGTSDLRIAKRIARMVRAKGGGLAFVKALGFELKERGIVQVSMNLVDYEKTPIFAAYENVKMYAERYGIPVIGSEIVGLVPQKALVQVADFYLRLENFKDDQIIEARLGKTDPVRMYLSSLSSSSPTPGGGSASAFSIAQGYALLSMVTQISLQSKKLSEYHQILKEFLPGLSTRLNQAITLISKDAEVFNSVMDAFKLPKETEEQKRVRREEIQKALKGASEIPLQAMELTVESMEFIEKVWQYGSKSAISDVGVAFYQFDSGFNGAKLNVLINLDSIKDENYVRSTKDKLHSLENQWKGFRDSFVEKISDRFP